MSFTKRKKKTRGVERVGCLLTQLLCFTTPHPSTRRLFSLGGSRLFNGWIETKWISFNRISHFFLFGKRKWSVGNHEHSKITFFPFFLFSSFFSLTIEGGKKDKKTKTGELRLDGKDNPDHQQPKIRREICPLHARTDGVEWRTGVMCRKIRKKSLPSRKRITRDESILTRKKKGQSLSPFSLANNRQSRTEFFFEWKSLSLHPPHPKNEIITKTQ